MMQCVIITNCWYIQGLMAKHQAILTALGIVAPPKTKSALEAIEMLASYLPLLNRHLWMNSILHITLEMYIILLTA